MSSSEQNLLIRTCVGVVCQEHCAVGFQKHVKLKIRRSWMFTLEKSIFGVGEYNYHLQEFDSLSNKDEIHNYSVLFQKVE